MIDCRTARQAEMLPVGVKTVLSEERRADLSGSVDANIRQL